MFSRQARSGFAVIIGLLLVFAGLNVQRSSANNYYFDLTNIRSARCNGDGGSLIWDASYNLPNNSRLLSIAGGRPLGSLNDANSYPSLGSIDHTKHTYSNLFAWSISPDYVFEGTPKYYTVQLWIRNHSIQNGHVYFSDGFNITIRCSGTSIMVDYSEYIPPAAE